jgi:hypothetical protein
MSNSYDGVRLIVTLGAIQCLRGGNRHEESSTHNPGYGGSPAPFRLMEALSLLRGDVILALAPTERNHRNLLLPGKRFKGRHECFANRVHQSAGGELVAAMKAKRARGGPVFRPFKSESSLTSYQGVAEREKEAVVGFIQSTKRTWSTGLL